VEQEFPACQRAPQVILQCQALRCLGVERGRVELAGVSALFLRAIHRHVGGLDQGLHGVAVGGMQADADAGRDEQLAPVDDERFVKRLDDLRDRLEHIVFLGDVHQHDDEFVAAQACNGVTRESAPFQYAATSLSNWSPTW
jgi:hypothetical protein